MKVRPASTTQTFLPPHTTSDLFSVDTGLNVRHLHKHIICFCFKLLPGRLLESQLFMSLKKILFLILSLTKAHRHTLCVTSAVYQNTHFTVEHYYIVYSQLKA